jgi:hypothetical protein
MFFDHVLLKNWWENDVDDDYKHSILVYNQEFNAFVAEESTIAMLENGHLTMGGGVCFAPIVNRTTCLGFG